MFACQTYSDNNLRSPSGQRRTSQKPRTSSSSSGGGSGSSSNHSSNDNDSSFSNDSESQYSAFYQETVADSQPELKQFCSKFPLTQVVPTLEEESADLVKNFRVTYSSEHPGRDLVRVIRPLSHSPHNQPDVAHYLKVEFEEPAEPNGGLIFHYDLNISFNSTLFIYKPVRITVQILKSIRVCLNRELFCRSRLSFAG